MVVVEEAYRRAMEAADKSRTSGVIEMLEVVLNCLEAGGVIGAPEVGKGRPRRMLVLWQERPYREQVLEKESRFGQSRIQRKRRREALEVALR